MLKTPFGSGETLRVSLKRSSKRYRKKEPERGQNTIIKEEMGRGENNLLFGKYPLTKGAPNGKESLRGKKGIFPAGAREFFLTSEGAIFRDKRDTLYSFDKNLKESSLKKYAGIPSHIDPASKITVGAGKLVWGGIDGFVIEDLAGKKGSFSKKSLPGHLSSIYINQTTIYATAAEEGNTSTTLYRSSALDESGWEELEGYSYGESSILQKGDTALIFYQETKNDTPAFVSLAESGPGKMIFLPRGFNNRDRTNIPFSLKLDNRNDPKNLITALGDNQCLAVSANEEGQAEISHFSIESFAASGPALSRLVAPLTKTNGITSMFFKDIAASKGRAVILGSCELIVVNGEGILDVIPFNEEDKRRYDRISFIDERAILWQNKYDAYQEFFIPQK